MHDETRTFTLGRMTYRSDGILHAVFEFDGEPTMDHAEEYLEIRQDLVGSQPVPVIIEIVRIPYTERDIRAFFMRGLGAARCRAVVTADQSYRTMFKTFQTMAPAPTPTQFFATVDAAIAWIQEIGRNDG